MYEHIVKPRIAVAPFVGISRSMSFEEACVSLNAARSQEDFYLRTRKKGRSNYSDLDQETARIESFCRERMCDWCYDVCDSDVVRWDREMVAVAFSYLDAYLDYGTCDREHYKLVALTSLYISTKILSKEEISLNSLAELCRGEFVVQDIQEMERSILMKLGWRMNPPTVQAFIRYLQQLSPVHCSLVRSTYEQANFFAELSVYDSWFADKDRYQIAVACMLNVIETLDDAELHQEDLDSLRYLRAGMMIDLDGEDLATMQSRLWFLYSCSGEALSISRSPLKLKESGLSMRSHAIAFSPSQSPTSVRPSRR